MFPSSIPTGNLWFTSDQHFLHANIIKYCDRPFKDIHHMTEELVRRHNSVVEHNDVVIMLGDFSLSVDALKVVHRLNGQKILLAGNHDKCWSGLGTKHVKFIQQYLDAGFDHVDPVGYVEHSKFGDADVHLCHFPFSGDHFDRDRYDKWRPVDDGRWVINGHVHDAWKVRGRQINVGVDVWDFTPVHSSQLLDIIHETGQS